MTWLRSVLVALLAVWSATAGAATCATGQQPWSGGGYSGSTALAACAAWIAGIGYFEPSVTQVTSVRYTCAGTSEEGRPGEDVGFVNQVCEPATTPDPLPEPQPVTVTCSSTCTATFVVALDASTALQQIRDEALAVFQDPTAAGLTPEVAAQWLGWGFGFVLGCFGLGWLVAVVVSVVRKV